MMLTRFRQAAVAAIALAAIAVLTSLHPAKAIDAGSSSNYDTTNMAASGYVLPTVGAGARITGATPSVPLGGTAANINDDNTGTTSTTSALGSLTGQPVASRIIAKLDLGSSQTVTQITAKSVSMSAGSSAADGLYYSTDNTNWTSYGGTFAASPTPTDRTGIATVTARYVAYVVEAQGYSTITYTIADLNAFGPPTTNNMTLVTTTQTADASASKVRVLVEYNPVVAITLNTDLTVEVTCNNGSNWASATLSLVTPNGQSGRSIAETEETTCTAGTQIKARVKTLNNKNVQLHGTAMSWR